MPDVDTLGLLAPHAPRGVGSRPTTAEDLIRRVSRLLFLGGALAATMLLLPPAPDADAKALAVVALLAVALGAGAAVLAARAATVARFEAVLVVASVVVATAVFFSGSLAVTFRFFYLWATPYAFAYLPLRRAMRHVALAAVLSTAAHALQPLRGAPATGTTELLASSLASMATVVVVGLLVHRISGELRAADRRFRLGFESSPTGWAFLSPEGQFLAVNRAFEQIVGRTADELVRLTVFDVGHPDEHEMLRARLAELTPTARTCEFEKRCVRADGVIVSSEVAVAMIGENGSTTLLAQVKDVTATRAAESALLHHSLHDPLTGLANRALLYDRIETSLGRARHTVGVLLIDLDNFKVLNDSAGHSMGDAALRAIAPRIVEAAGPHATVARPGGDEFAVMCPDLASPGDIGLLAVRIAESIRAPLALGESTHVLTASIGIVLAREGMTAEDVLRNADIAMYKAKARGRNRIELFDEDGHRDASRRLTIEQELRAALQHDALVLHYQPVFEAAGGHIVAVEALVRWQHPQRGLIPPADFMPVAEESGLIAAVDEWVLRAAAATLGRWEAQGVSGVRMCVNISPRRLVDPDFIELLAGVIRAQRLRTGSLCIEITETSLLEPAAAAVHSLNAARALGVVIALDDFGTGFSSLSYLHRFPIDILKVDRSFVGALGSADAAAVVGAIANLGQALQMTVVAEGVETADQLERVAGLGCHLVQGFYLARPLDEQDVAQRLGLHR